MQVGTSRSSTGASVSHGRAAIHTRDGSALPIRWYVASGFATAVTETATRDRRRPALIDEPSLPNPYVFSLV
jgi:hypothetical protein